MGDPDQYTSHSGLPRRALIHICYPDLIIHVALFHSQKYSNLDNKLFYYLMIWLFEYIHYAIAIFLRYFHSSNPYSTCTISTIIMPIL